MTEWCFSTIGLYRIYTTVLYYSLLNKQAIVPAAMGLEHYTSFIITLSITVFSGLQATLSLEAPHQLPGFQIIPPNFLKNGNPGWEATPMNATSGWYLPTQHTCTYQICPRGPCYVLITSTTPYNESGLWLQAIEGGFAPGKTSKVSLAFNMRIKVISASFAPIHTDTEYSLLLVMLTLFTEYCNDLGKTFARSCMWILENNCISEINLL